MFYYTLSFDPLSPCYFFIEEQSLQDAVLKNTLLSSIQTTICCIGEILENPEHFHCSRVPQNFNISSVASNNSVSIISCVVEQLLRLSFLSLEQQEDLKTFSTAIWLLQHHANEFLSIKIPDTSSDFTTTINVEQNLPSSSAVSSSFMAGSLSPFQQTASSPLSTSQPFFLEDFLPTSMETTPSSTFDENILDDILEILDKANSPQPLTALTLPIANKMDTVEKDSSPYSMLTPQENKDLAIENNETPSSSLIVSTSTITSPIASISSKKRKITTTQKKVLAIKPLPLPKSLDLSKRERFSDDEDLSSDEFIHAITPLYSPSAEGIVYEPSSSTTTDMTSSHEKSSSLPLQKILLPLNQSKNIFQGSDSALNKPIMPESSMTFLDLIYSDQQSIVHLLETLVPWPGKIFSAKDSAHFYRGITFNINKQKTQLTVSKRHISSHPGSLKNFLLKTSKNILTTLKSKDITIIPADSIPGVPNKDLFLNKDLILTREMSFTDEEYKTLQLLYLFKLHVVLLIQHMPSSDIPITTTDCLNTLQQKTNQLLIKEYNASFVTLPSSSSEQHRTAETSSPSSICTVLSSASSQYDNEESMDLNTVVSPQEKQKIVMPITNRSQLLYTSEEIESLQARFAKDLDKSLSSLSFETIQQWKLNTKISLSAIVNQNNFDIYKPENWPAEQPSSPKYIPLVSTTFCSSRNTLSLRKLFISFHDHTKHGYLNGLKSKMMQALMDPSVCFIISGETSKNKTTDAFSMNSDLILFHPSVSSQPHCRLLQLLYLQKIIITLIKNHSSTSISFFESFINFFQEQSTKLFNAALIIDPNLSTDDYLLLGHLPTANSFFISKPLSIGQKRKAFLKTQLDEKRIKIGPLETDSSSDQPVLPRTKTMITTIDEKKVQCDSPKADTSCHQPVLPITETMIAPLLLDDSDFVDLLTKEWRNFPLTSSIVNTIGVYTNNRMSQLTIVKSQHSKSMHHMRNHRDAFFKNLKLLVTHSIPLTSFDSKFILRDYDATQESHRLLQAFFILKLIMQQMNLFPNDFLCIDLVFHEYHIFWKNHLLFYLQKYTKTIPASFYQKYMKTSCLLPTSTFSYEDVFNPDIDHSQGIIWPAKNNYGRHAEFISIEPCSKFLTPVLLIKKTILSKTTLDKAIKEIQSSINILINCTIPLQTNSPELLLKKPGQGESLRTHYKIQGLFFWKMLYKKLELTWPVTIDNKTDEIMTFINNLQEECQKCLAEDLTSNSSPEKPSSS